MKKILALFVCLLAVAFTIQADNDRSISFNQLPAEAQTFVKAYFSNEKVLLVKLEKELFGKQYEVVFANSTKVEFDKNGNWKEVDCRQGTVPEGIVPVQIIRFVNANYQGQAIVEIHKDRTEYEVKLANRMELTFDKNFNLIDIDD